MEVPSSSTEEVVQWSTSVSVSLLYNFSSLFPFLFNIKTFSSTDLVQDGRILGVRSPEVVENSVHHAPHVVLSGQHAEKGQGLPLDGRLGML